MTAVRVKGIVITTDKKIKEVEAEGLEPKQAIVGGLIQAVQLRDGSTMWVNEEGKVYDLPFNSIATDVALLSGAIFVNDYIAGNVLVVGPCDEDGNDTDYTTTIKRDIDRVAREA